MLRPVFILVLLIITSCAANKPPPIPKDINPVFEEYSINGSIRALEVITDDHVWFAGSGSQFGWTTDGGKHWTIDSISIIPQTVDFRAITVTDHAVFLLNAGSPAWLLKSTDQGQTWDIVYSENHPGTFYDSMKFWDNEHGIAMGDPIEGCLSVILTTDGGASWSKLNCSELPATKQGEAAFAASNTNIALSGSHAWLATGGAGARVIHSPDMGETWEAFDTPIVHGGKMTGIFTIDFYDTRTGIIFGGDWEEQSNNSSNKAITSNGGQSWELITDGQDPGYRSCVQYVPNSNGTGVIAVGIPGISYSGDGGGSWQHLGQEYFYTIRMTPSGTSAWLAGKGKIARMIW